MDRPSTLSLGSVLELTGGGVLGVGGFEALGRAFLATDATIGFILFVAGAVGLLSGWLLFARGAADVVAAGVERAGEAATDGDATSGTPADD